MSKVTTKRLSRGVRMLGSHVVGQLGTLLGQFTPSAQISTENLKADKGTFRLNFHVPVFKGQDALSGGGPNHLPISISLHPPSARCLMLMATTQEQFLQR